MGWGRVGIRRLKADILKVQGVREPLHMHRGDSGAIGNPSGCASSTPSRFQAPRVPCVLGCFCDAGVGSSTAILLKHTSSVEEKRYHTPGHPKVFGRFEPELFVCENLNPGSLSPSVSPYNKTDIATLEHRNLPFSFCRVSKSDLRGLRAAILNLDPGAAKRKNHS